MKHEFTKKWKKKYQNKCFWWWACKWGPKSQQNGWIQRRWRSGCDRGRAAWAPPALSAASPPPGRSSPWWTGGAPTQRACSAARSSYSPWLKNGTNFNILLNFVSKQPGNLEIWGEVEDDQINEFVDEGRRRWVSGDTNSACNGGGRITLAINAGASGFTTP